MSLRLALIGLFLPAGLLAQHADPAWPAPVGDTTRVIRRIVLGSCAHQDKRQPLLDEARSLEPDLFLFLGDNLYGDTRNMGVLRKKYRKLGRKREHRELRASTTALAVWDDHDYGENDAGRHYPQREASKRIFLAFWGEPEDSPRRRHPGIHHALHFGPLDRRVQVILLDTRTFRDDLLPNDGLDGHKNDYRPNPSPDSTFLGAEQWAWLDSVLRLPARVRVVMSSNQFAHAYNGWESWTNVPHERERMLETIRRQRAEGVLFVSGDVHWGELSRLEAPGLYPIHDLTSSGITQTWPDTEPNAHRVGEVVRENNIGILDIDWSSESPSLRFRIRDERGADRVDHQVPLDLLRMP